MESRIFVGEGGSDYCGPNMTLRRNSNPSFNKQWLCQFQRTPVLNILGTEHILKTFQYNIDASDIF